MMTTMLLRNFGSMAALSCPILVLERWQRDSPKLVTLKRVLPAPRMRIWNVDLDKNGGGERLKGLW
jgi:hypothetical protein